MLTPTDLAGQPRIQGDSVDLGAYESPALGLVTAPDIKPACVNTANGSINAEIVGACLPYTLAWQAGNQPALRSIAWPPGRIPSPSPMPRAAVHL